MDPKDIDKLLICRAAVDKQKDALCYVDLGGPVDMTAGDLTVTWNGSGLFTITKAA